MSDVLSFYEQAARDVQSTVPELAKIQEQGLSSLLEKGFPTRHDEDWKYSAPDLLLNARFKCSSIQLPKPKIAGGVVYTIEEAMHSPLRETVLSHLLTAEQGFHALNTAMLTQGFVIHIPVGMSLSEPVILSHGQRLNNEALYVRYVVIAEAGSSVTVIEDYIGEPGLVYLTSSITQVFLEQGAEVTHVVNQRESHEAYHLSHVFAYLAKDSCFNSHVMNLGGKWVRSDKSLYLQGEGAHCLMNGVYGLIDGQHMDHHTAVYHEVPNCTSAQDYKGIVAGAGQAVFNGRVVVLKDAQKSKASQQNKNLMLSLQGEVDTKPQLEIFANDVVCSHGATVGQLDEEALFYFASRGLTSAEAIAFLVEAFTASNIALIEQASSRTALSAVLQAHLGEKHVCKTSC